jgi:hypothetical protein
MREVCKHTVGRSTTATSRMRTPYPMKHVRPSNALTLPQNLYTRYTFTGTLRGRWRTETRTGGGCRHRRPVGRGVLCEVDFAVGSVDDLVVVTHDDGL